MEQSINKTWSAHFFIMFFLMFFASSCFKTAEDIARDQMVDEMKIQLDQSSQLIVQLKQELQSLGERVDLKAGSQEEQAYAQQNLELKITENLKETNITLGNRIEALEQQLASQSDKIAQLQTLIKNQKDYISKVNTSLKGLTTEVSGDSYSKARSLFERNQYDQALNLYLEVIEDKKSSAAQVNQSWQDIGLIYYHRKQYDQALVYFSKTVTTYPKSSIAHRSLYYVGKSFELAGKNEEAKLSYQKLIKDYPQSPNISLAKKHLNSLK